MYRRSRIRPGVVGRLGRFAGRLHGLRIAWALLIAGITAAKGLEIEIGTADSKGCDKE